jgi:hypothetical protein
VESLKKEKKSVEESSEDMSVTSNEKNDTSE